MKRILFFISLVLSVISSAQAPTINSQLNVGTIRNDLFYDAVKLSNGTFLVGFTSDSIINGDKTTTNFGDYDAWVVNLNSDYSINWQKNFGGTAGDDVPSFLELSNGDILLLCYSESGISGNKTLDTIGRSDFWLIKIDTLGNIIWQKTYGGSGYDSPEGIIDYKDGFLLFGRSDSPISGHKTESNRGFSDFWMLRIDSLGNVIWDKTIGTSNYDQYPSLCTNSEDIFLLGRTDGGATGDKTENSYGFEDAWLMKLDSNGVLVNQKTIGGDNFDYLSDIFILNNKLYLLGGTQSDVSGNKTSSLLGSTRNAWLLQLDYNLNILTDQTIGGDINDYFSKSLIINQNQIVYIGSSNSNINQWKDQSDRGSGDVWLVAFDTLGNQLWNRSFGGSGSDQGYIVLEKSPNVFSTFNFSDSPISGDKTTPNLGSYDLWIVEISTTLEILEQDQQMVYAYPNPSTTQLFIQSDLFFENYEIYDMAGKLVEQADFNSTITTSQLKNGVYQLILSNKDTSRRVRFVKE